MNAAIELALKIERDVALLRQMLDSDGETKPSIIIKVPVLKKSYTPAAATREKDRIEAAFQAGLISYDKKRGMKRTVTHYTTN